MDEDKKKGSAEEERRLHCMSFSVSLGFSFLSIAMAVVKDASFLPWSHSRHVLDINTRRIKLEKFLMIAFVVSLNFIFIFASHWWSRYYYVYLPFIALQLALNCVQVLSISFFFVFRRRWIRPEAPVVPASPENIIYLIPCYNETLEELQGSLDSLAAQRNVQDHKRAVLVVCDGRVKGKGMAKTTAAYLVQDILGVGSGTRMRRAYVAWDGALMDVEMARGVYKGLQVFCLIKDQNRGKRDSLIFARSFLHNFNIRAARPRVIFSPELFAAMAEFLLRRVDVESVDFLVGMDADTRFDPDCVHELVKSARYENVAGVCGYVAVDFSRCHHHHCFSVSLWYQHAEYTIAQGLRRLHQSIATRKVSCLPGCCQLLRVEERTCGDQVLIKKFGYYPTRQNGLLAFTRANASEDRNHVCLMLTTFPDAQTRQALRARAYTDVPHKWAVFLSQRRRWTLGATSNDLLLFLAGKTQWWERIIAFSNVMAWVLNIFILASIYAMIRAFMFVPWFIIIAFATIMIIPYLWYLGIAIWIPRTAVERGQYLLGLLLFTFLGPFVNVAVQAYAFFYMDSFGWGKTRKVVGEDDKRETDGSTGLDGEDSMSATSSDENISVPQTRADVPVADFPPPPPGPDGLVHGHFQGRHSTSTPSGLDALEKAQEFRIDEEAGISEPGPHTCRFFVPDI